MASTKLFSTAKASDNATIGTSFFNDTIRTNVNQLRKHFGEPDYCDLDGKVNYEWEVELRIREHKDDTEYRAIPFTLYDWKEGYFSDRTKIYFHIGARNAEESAIVKDYLSHLHL